MIFLYKNFRGNCYTLVTFLMKVMYIYNVRQTESWKVKCHVQGCHVGIQDEKTNPNLITLYFITFRISLYRWTVVSLVRVDSINLSKSFYDVNHKFIYCIVFQNGTCKEWRYVGYLNWAFFSTQFPFPIPDTHPDL